MHFTLLRPLLLGALFITALPAYAQKPRVMRIAVAPAETLHVSISGRGDPVVIVPGIWSLTYAFRKVIPPLADGGMQVIVIEPLGVASSGRPQKADYSITAQSRRIGAALDSLGVREALFIGQALSTSMLLRLAIEAPYRVRGIVSLEGGATETSASPGLKMGFAVAAVLFRIIPSRGIMRRRLRRDLENVSGDRSWITNEVVDNYLAPWTRKISATLNAYRAIAGSKEPGPMRPSLGKVQAPLQLLVGTAPHFGATEPEEIDPFATMGNRFTITRISGAGHLIHEERPKEVVAAVIALRRRLGRQR